MDIENSSRVAALLERLSRLATTERYAAGLKPVHWEVLRYLSRANRFSNTAMPLTAYLGVTKGTVSQSIKALESKGLIRKGADGRDRRSVRLFLTAAGQRMLSKDPIAEFERAVSALPASIQTRLTDDLELLLTQRLSARNRQPFGLCRDCRFFGRNHPEGAPHRCLLLEQVLSESDSELICFEQSAA